MFQKIKHTKKYNSIFVIGLTVAMVACGTTATDGFVSDDKLLKGSAFDDSQNSSSQGNLSLRVRCKIRSNRSKVSVDATGIASGTYKATVASGGVEVTSGTANSVGDEVEFDFSSNFSTLNKVGIYSHCTLGNISTVTIKIKLNFISD